VKQIAAVLLALLWIAGCGKKADEAGTGTGTGTAAGTGTGAGTGSTVEDAAAASACELAGDYRLQFRTNGSEGWLLRFSIADGKGTFTEPQVMLGVDRAPLTAVTLDAAACKLNVRGSGLSSGEIGLALQVDAKTGAVTGQMTRTKAVSEEDKAVPVAGWRTTGAPTMPDPCYVPGIYKVTIDPKATWRNPDDDRSCKDQQPTDVLVRVEAWGDSVLIDQVDAEPPHDQVFGSETVTRSGCEVALGLVSEAIDLNAQLTFVGGQVMGLVTKATIQVVEETDESEEIWSCALETASVKLVKL
jgi:hypothetical protein